MPRLAAVSGVIFLGLIVGTMDVCGQGVISGVVKDSSGAVLPGVSVEASSPVLIERTRSVVTSESGQYRIIDLRPGLYTVTFVLPGFTTVKREAIELPANFTATVNAEMAVGSLNEELTVTGESPVVDVQNAVVQSVMTRATLDAVPTGRNVFAIGALIPGTTAARPDVGGSEGMQQGSFQVHGSEVRDISFHVDGMTVNSNFGTGQFVGVYYNDGMMEQVTYTTSALPAEVSQGGIRINMIPREGGNQFHGAVFGTASSHGMQNNNLSDQLRVRGLRAQNRLDKIYDLNFSIGGPIQRDRLWFFSTFRRWGVNRLVANTFNPDGSQALDDNHITSGILRLTYQLTKRNKIAAYYDKNVKYRGHRRDTSSDYQFIEPRASYVQITPLGYTSQLKWTSTVTPKLLIESGISLFFLHYKTGYQPEVKPADVAKIDFVRSTLTNAVVNDYDSWATSRTYSSSVSYVTGGHAFKTGIQFREGPYRETYTINQDMILRFNNGAPNSVDVYNTPVDVREKLRTDLGIYAQDTWTIGRLTLNPGIRIERFNTSILEQNAPAGRFVPARHFNEIPNVPNWNTVVPRFGLAYDLFGNTKTALKASASKYEENEGVGLAHRVNPMFLSFDRRSWTDSNNDGEAQLTELGPSTGFRGGVNQRIDPNLKRPYQWEYTFGLEHAISSNFSLGATYFHRDVRDVYGIKNLAVTATNYIPVTITNPLTGTAFTVFNQDPATRGRIDSLLSNYKELNHFFNGFEVKANSRLSKGATLFGGVTIGRKRGSIRGVNDDLNNPNVLINHVGAADLDSTYQYKAAGTYPLPLGINISGALQSNTGQPLRRIYSVTQTQVPNLTQVSMSLDAVERGKVRLPRMNLLDIRLSKFFGIGESKLEAVADIYNLLNRNSPVAEVETIGPALARPVAILEGRLLRLGAKFNF